VSEPDCSGLPNRTVPKTSPVTIEAGVYDENKWTGGDLTLSPGLYCVTGSKGIAINGGSVLGNGVTIFIQTGGVTINGNVSPC